MDLCNAAQMKALLEEHGFHFSKAKGQNFLTAAWVPQRIAEEAGVDAGAGVLEVGPGVGPLTEQLCLRAGKVLAVELDRRLKPILKKTVGSFDNLELRFADVMELDLADTVRETFPGLRPMACANLPYYITSPILTRLLESRAFDSVTVMIQKEVAQRICAEPGVGEGSAFAVFCHWYAEPRMLFDVPPDCFLPRPKVSFCICRYIFNSHGHHAENPTRAPLPRGGRSAVLPGGPGGLCPAAENPDQRPGSRLPRPGQGRTRRSAGGLRPVPHGPGRDAEYSAVCRRG